MAFLKINGITVPVKECRNQVVEIGSRDRGINGAAAMQRRAVKRKWSVTTAPLDFVTGDALWNLVQGRGMQADFSAVANPQTTSLLATASLQGAADAAAGPIVESNTAADTAPVVHMTGATTYQNAAKFSGAALYTAPATTNVLTANQSSVETNTTGFTVIGSASLAQTGSSYWTGTKALAITMPTAAGNHGVVVDAFATTPAAAYAASVYVKCATSVTVVLAAVSSTPTTITNQSYTIPANTWCRLFLNFTATTATSTLQLYMTAPTGQILIADGLMVEAQGAITFNDFAASQWTIGGATRSTTTGVSYVPGLLQGVYGCTLSLWTKGAAYSTGTEVLLHAYDAAGNAWQSLYFANGTIKHRYLDPSLGNLNNAGSTIAPSGNAWKHIAGVWDPYSSQIRLYVDGALVDTDATSAVPAQYVEPGYIRIGAYTSDTTNVANSGIDRVTVLPYAAPASFITALYGEPSYSWGTLPYVTIEGEICHGRVTCLGSVSDGSYIRLHRSTGIGQNLMLQFSLEEV